MYNNKDTLVVLIGVFYAHYLYNNIKANDKNPI
jgi:hypothetical protein